MPLTIDLKPLTLVLYLDFNKNSHGTFASLIAENAL